MNVLQSFSCIHNVMFTSHCDEENKIKLEDVVVFIWASLNDE